MVWQNVFGGFYINYFKVPQVPVFLDSHQNLELDFPKIGVSPKT